MNDPVQNMLLCGQPGSGKSTIGKAIVENYRKVVLIDGDLLRMASGNADYGKEGRMKNVEQAVMVAKILNANGYSTVLALVAPYMEMRQKLMDELSVLKVAYLSYNKAKFHRPRQGYWVENFEEGNFDEICNTGKESIVETFAKINSLWLRV